MNRNKSGIKNCTEEDCGWIEFIKCMRNAGLPIEVIIEYVGLYQQCEATTDARKELIIEQCNLLIEKMEDTRKTLERLNYKIERYEHAIAPVEHELKKSDD